MTGACSKRSSADYGSATLTLHSAVDSSSRPVNTEALTEITESPSLSPTMREGPRRHPINHVYCGFLCSYSSAWACHVPTLAADEVGESMSWSNAPEYRLTKE